MRKIVAILKISSTRVVYLLAQDSRSFVFLFLCSFFYAVQQLNKVPIELQRALRKTRDAIKSIAVCACRAQKQVQLKEGADANGAPISGAANGGGRGCIWCTCRTSCNSHECFMSWFQLFGQFNIFDFFFVSIFIRGQLVVLGVRM